MQARKLILVVFHLNVMGKRVWERMESAELWSKMVK